MKKVVFSVTKLGKFESKLSGIGYVTDEDLLVPCISKNQKPYIRVFEDCVDKCRPIPGKEGEFKGMLYEIRNVEYETKFGSKDTREVEIEYSVWFKYAS